MYAVGQGQGNVHPDLHQGVGLATVLGPSTADDYAIRYAEHRGLARQKAIEDRAAKRNAALQKMAAEAPDFFYAHQKEVSKAYNDAIALGINAMKAGVTDPWNDTSEKSIAFQKAMADVSAKSKFSTQIRDQYKAFQQDVQAKGPDYFDPDSLIESERYFFKTSLFDMMNGPNMTPLVQQRKPLQNAIDIASGWAGKLREGATKDGMVDDKLLNETVRTAFRDPETAKATNETFMGALSRYSQDERAALENEARQAGLSPQEMYAVKTTKAFLKSKEPYSVNDALAAGDKLFTPTQRDWKGTEKFSSRPDEALSMKSATSVAKGILHDDPRALGEFAAYYRVKQDPNETEAEFMDEVTQKLAVDLYKRAPKKFEAGEVARAGGGGAEQDARANDWLQNMLSNDPYWMNQAAGVLQGVDYLGNLSVSNAKVVPNAAGAVYNTKTGMMTQPFDLNLSLKTPVTVKMASPEEAQDYIAGEIKKETGADIPPGSIHISGYNPSRISGGSELDTSGDAEVQQGAGEYQVAIHIDPQNAQLLETLYRRADKKGTVWRGRKNLPGPEGFPGSKSTTFDPFAPAPIAKKDSKKAPIYNF